jgi:hypothetical protein
VQMAERPAGEGDEFEDEEFEDDTASALDRLESGEDWETVVDDLFGRDATLD